jgi:secreted Zn-dependent insulinase-like peptidase
MLEGKSDKIPKYNKIDNSLNTYLKMNYDLNTKDTQLFIAIYKDDIYENIENYINYIFYFEYFKLLNNHLMFDINKANYNVDLLLNKSNYTIGITGYYSKISEILEMLITKFKQLNNKDMDKLSFEIIKNKLEKKFKNLKYDALYKKTSSYEDEIILNKYFNTELIESEIKKMSMDKLNNMNLFEYSRITVFAEGNINTEYYDDLCNILNKNYNYNKLYKDNEINIKPNILNKQIEKDFEKQNKKDPNSCLSKVVVIDKFEYSSESIKNQCLINIFDIIVSKEFFDLLRTKDQLGYIVNSRMGTLGFTDKKNLVFRFLVQSSVKNTEFLEKRINKFINNEIKEILDNLNLEELEEIKKSLKEKYSKPFNTLGESAYYNYDKILNKSFMYNHNEIISSNILECAKEELINFYNKYFIDNQKYIEIKIE